LPEDPLKNRFLDIVQVAFLAGERAEKAFKNLETSFYRPQPNSFHAGQKAEIAFRGLLYLFIARSLDLAMVTLQAAQKVETEFPKPANPFKHRFLDLRKSHFRPSVKQNMRPLQTSLSRQRPNRILTRTEGR
jgi:hypothetical protein